mmetsp:Transcript_67598/g.136136  ORF Transcript_67598/g.136136 Transcript_67598/m.136136 type:complete len:118 (+) Transcript_67598:22-375(+)
MPKEDATPIAEMKNWADRVSSEINSGVHWEGDWGSLYKPGEPQGYTNRIKDLESKLEKMAGVQNESTYRSQFKPAKPFTEIIVPVAGARSAELSTMDADEIIGSSGTTNPKIPRNAR